MFSGFDETKQNSSDVGLRVRDAIELRSIDLQEHPQDVFPTNYFIIFAKNKIHEDHRMRSVDDRALHHFDPLSSISY